MTTSIQAKRKYIKNKIKLFKNKKAMGKTLTFFNKKCRYPKRRSYAMTRARTTGGKFTKKINSKCIFFMQKLQYLPVELTPVYPYKNIHSLSLTMLKPMDYKIDNIFI
jgi:hypothetical protein